MTDAEHREFGVEAVGAAVDGRVLQDADGVVVDVEAPHGTLFGWTPSDLLHDAAPALLHPDDREIASKVRNTVRVRGGSQQLQLRLRAKNGRWLWAEVTLRAVPTADGRTGLLTEATLRDVSERYLGEETMALLIDLRHLISSASTIEAAWQAGLERIGRLASFARAVVWEWVDGEFVDTHEWHSDAPDAAQPSHGDRSSDLPGYLQRVWRDGDPLWVALAANRGDASMPEPPKPAEMRSTLLVPTLAGDDVVAIVEFGGASGDGHHRIETRLIVEVLGALGDAVRGKTGQIELALARQRFELAFSEASIGMALVGLDGSFIEANDALCKLLERSHDEIRSVGFQALTHQDDLEADLAYVHQMLAGEIATYQLEKRYIRPGGEIVWGLLSVSLVRDDAGAPVHFISQIQDITGRKVAELQVQRSMARFRAAFDDSALGMALVAIDPAKPPVIVEANDELGRIADRPAPVLVGTPVEHLVASSAGDDFVAELVALSADDPALRSELPARRGGGGERWLRLMAAPVRYDDDDAGRFVVLQIEDITEERRIRSEISHLAMHDALTGLPNRALMLDRIRGAQERSVRSKRHVGLLFIDLDGFKEVNDTFGHGHGDRLLTRVAERFRSGLRPNDSAARLGGDEFVVMCEELSEDRAGAERELAGVADRLHRQLAEPISVEGHEFRVTASIGTRVASGIGESVSEILSSADHAMYQAKALGPSRTAVYDAAVRSRNTERLALAEDLRIALRDGQVDVAYQPIVSLESEEPVGAEALLRWTDAERGVVSPAQFVDVAEQSGLIVDLGRFVLDRACSLLSRPETSPGYITVNVSGRQLSQSDFVETVHRGLDVWGLDPGRLALELTETVLVEASSSSHRQLAELRDSGIRIGIDDFGTGFATLRYVKDLPVTFLKIDRSFTAGLTSDRGDFMICKAVIGLANALGLDAVAEGVETRDQADVLRGLGCPHAQGYLFGRPTVPVDGASS